MSASACRRIRVSTYPPAVEGDEFFDRMHFIHKIFCTIMLENWSQQPRLVEASR